MELADTDRGLVVLDKDEEKIGVLREYTENAYVVRNLEKKTLFRYTFILAARFDRFCARGT